MTYESIFVQHGPQLWTVDPELASSCPSEVEDASQRKAMAESNRGGTDL